MSYPIYINNRDRVTTTKAMVDWLISAGETRITILDNDSTYPPLLEWYKQLPASVRIDYLGDNLGPHALWLRGYHLAQDTPFIYTDSDLIPDENCPKDLIKKLYDLLTARPGTRKVGPGLLGPRPDWEHECGFWSRRYNQEAFIAPIDTTFALYPAQAPHGLDGNNNLRMDRPYVFKHWPSYLITGGTGIYQGLTDEERYYRVHANREFSHAWAAGVE
jgi:hypothetical protein